MKTRLLPLLCSIAAITGPSVSAQESEPPLVWYTLNPQTFSFNTTIKTMVEGTFVTEEDEDGKPVKVPAFESLVETYDKNDNLTRAVSTYASKISSLRYANAQFLAELAAAEVLPDGTARGWALFIAPASQTDGEWDDANPGFEIVARKKGQADVPVGDFVSLELLSSVAAINSSVTTNYKYSTVDEEEIVTATATGKGSYSHEGAAYLTLVYGEEEAIVLAGTMTESGSEFWWNPDPADKSQLAYLPVSRGVKIAGLAGFGGGGSEESEFEESASVVWATGTASVGSTKAIKAPTPPSVQ
jgi:hypothetical protein